MRSMTCVIWILMFFTVAGTGCKNEPEGTARAEPAPVAPVVVPTGTTPEAAFKNYQQALRKRDLDFLWSFICEKEKRGDFGAKLYPMNGKNVPASRLQEFADGFHTTPEGVRAMSKPDFDKHFLGMVFEKGAVLIVEQRIANVSITGDTAILDLEVDGEFSSKLALVRDAGQWHMDMGGTSAANGH